MVQRLCTKPEHKDGEHDIFCVPPASPESPEIRLLRAIYGLCPECDNSDQWHLVVGHD